MSTWEEIERKGQAKVAQDQAQAEKERQARDAEKQEEQLRELEAKNIRRQQTAQLRQHVLGVIQAKSLLQEIRDQVWKEGDVVSAEFPAAVECGSRIGTEPFQIVTLKSDTYQVLWKSDTYPKKDRVGVRGSITPGRPFFFHLQDSRHILQVSVGDYREESVGSGGPDAILPREELPDRIMQRVVGGRMMDTAHNKFLGVYVDSSYAFRLDSEQQKLFQPYDSSTFIHLTHTLPPKPYTNHIFLGNRMAVPIQEIGTDAGEAILVEEFGYTLFGHVGGRENNRNLPSQLRNWYKTMIDQFPPELTQNGKVGLWELSDWDFANHRRYSTQKPHTKIFGLF